MSQTEAVGDIRDRWWRLQNLYVIRDKNRALRKMRFNPAQTRIVETVRPLVDKGLPVRHIDLKSRQIGDTTFWALYYLDDTMFNRNVISFLVAQKQDTLDLIWNVVRLAYERMPSALRPDTRKESAKTLSFPELNSSIEMSLRVLSTTLHNLLVSEYALCDPLAIEETLAAVPKTANITLETVPKGVNHARDKWVEKGDGFTRCFHPWFRQAEYSLPAPPAFVRTNEEKDFAERTARRYDVKVDDEQLCWRRKTKRELKSLFKEQFAEDEDSCFLASGGQYFDAEKVTVLRDEARAELEKNPPVVQDDELLILERPQHKHVYVAGADVAEGDDGDYSVLTILCTTCRQVALRYRAHCGVDAFYRLLYRRGMEYNRALLCPERNNHGHAVILGLRELNYPNLWRDPKDRRKTLSAPKSDPKFGWLTTGDSKPIMLDALRQAVEGDSEEDAQNFEPEFTILDEEFLSEMLNIREAGGKIGSVAGKHDDVVMSYAIAWQMYRIATARTSLGKGRIITGETLESV